MIKHMVLIASLLASGSVFAQANDGWGDWVAKSTLGLFYLRTDRFKVVDDNQKIAEYWMKIVVTNSNNGTKLKKDMFMVAKYQVNCSEKKTLLLASTEYNKNGSLFRDTETYDPTAWEDMIPSTADEGLAIEVCDTLFPKSAS